MIRVTIYNEGLHERTESKIREIYPEGMHKAIADFLTCDDISVRTFTLYNDTVNIPINDENPWGEMFKVMKEVKPTLADELTDEVLDNTDVLMWWGHAAHQAVPDEVIDRCVDHVHRGMGVILLHSAHHSKLFKRLMGTPCGLCWGPNVKERLWNIAPDHPILQGIGKFIDLPKEEMYGEQFQIPEPDQLLMIGTYASHEVFRSLCTFRRNYGKVVYFQPGHEENPTYYIPEIQTIIRNAVRWAAPTYRVEKIECPMTNPYEF